jgi:hypothetical protein
MAKDNSITWRSVWSQSATRIGYDEVQAELLVEWKRTGKISVYFPDFPFEQFDKLSKSVSVGNMIRDEIAPKYQHRYLA